MRKIERRVTWERGEMGQWKERKYGVKRICANVDRLVDHSLTFSFSLLAVRSWDKELMSFDNFVDEKVLSPEKGEKLAYLAQHPLLQQIPNLQDDLPSLPYAEALDDLDKNAPEECEFRRSPIYSAWIGPGGTVSPLHNDPYHNLYLQVVGRKYVRIYSISETASLYPMKGERCNTSNVNVDDPNDKLYPLFKDAPYQEVVLEPGDMLYIPRLSWHYIRSLEPSINVSMWWGARMGLREVSGEFKPVY